MIVSHELKLHFLNLFIEKFKDQALPFQKNGLKDIFPEDGIDRLVKFTPLCVIADVPARAVLQNHVQYNRYDSCTYCYQHGKHVNCVKFPFAQSECELRTHESHMEDI